MFLDCFDASILSFLGKFFFFLAAHAINSPRFDVFCKTFLSKKIEKLKKIGVPVICPAGNIGKDPGDVDLEFPGADDDALAITSVDIGSQLKLSYQISKLSKYANAATDEVAFCAFGGEAIDSLLLSTYSDFGFCAVSGTSVSAAITAGIAVSTKSRWHRSNLSRNLTKTLSGAGVTHQILMNGIRTGKMPYVDLINILKSDASKVFSHSSLPDSVYGYGLILEPYQI